MPDALVYVILGVVALVIALVMKRGHP